MLPPDRPPELPAGTEPLPPWRPLLREARERQAIGWLEEPLNP